VELRVVLHPDADVDADDVERLGRQLRNELRDLDVDEVVSLGPATAPEGAKGAAEAVTEWLVTMSGSGGVFVGVVATIRAWLARRAGAHKVTLSIDGDTIEVSGATAAEQAQLVDTVVRRHQPV
jgi:hypothetical protein